MTNSTVAPATGCIARCKNRLKEVWRAIRLQSGVLVIGGAGCSKGFLIMLIERHALSWWSRSDTLDDSGTTEKLDE